MPLKYLNTGTLNVIRSLLSLPSRRHAALRGERILPARHELPERHVQPAPAGRAAGPARARLPALRARAHPRRETCW